MESIEVSAKTIEDAVLEAAIQLGTTRDKVAYEVITQPTSGFLGIGGRKAVIRAHQKSDEEIEAKEKADKEMEKLLNRVNEKKEAPKPSEPVKKTEAPKKQEKPVEAKKQAAPKSEEPKAALASAVKKSRRPRLLHRLRSRTSRLFPVDTAPVEKFLKDVFGAMGMEVTVNITQNPQDREMNITLDGADMGVLIAREARHWILCSIFPAWWSIRTLRITPRKGGYRELSGAQKGDPWRIWQRISPRR